MYKSGLILFCLSLLLLQPGAAFGNEKAVPLSQTLAPHPLPLTQMMQTLRQHHPKLQALRQQWEAARARVKLASALPDPTISSGWRNVGFDRLSLGQEMMSSLSLMVSQTLPQPNKLALKEKLALETLHTTLLDYAQAEEALITQLKKTYYQTAYTLKALEVLTEMQGLTDKLKQTATAKYKVGKVSQEDILRTQLAHSKLEAKKIQLNQRLEQDLLSLSALLGGEALPAQKPTLPNVQALAYSLQHLQTRLNQQALPLRQSRIAQAKARWQVALAQAEFIPDLSISGGLMNRGFLSPIWEVKLGTSLPLNIENKQGLALKAAEFEAQKSHSSHQDLQLAQETRLKQLLVELQAESKLMRFSKQVLIPEARLTFDASLAGYLGDKVDFMRVLNNLNTLLEEELNLYQKESLYFMVLAELEQLLAADIPQAYDWEMEKEQAHD